MYISFVIKHLQNFFFFSLCYAFICNCYPLKSLDLKSLYAIGLHLHCQQKRILDFYIFYLCLAVFKRAVVKFGKLLSRIISFKENWGDLSSESITKHYISTVYIPYIRRTHLLIWNIGHKKTTSKKRKFEIKYKIYIKNIC